VSEASPVGSYIVDSSSSRHAPLVVEAVDEDSGPNALLTYSIGDAVAGNVFEIDSATGAVRTRVVLDREVRSVYEFVVSVRDSGSPSLTAESDVTVTVYVDDINDTPPTFSQQVRSSILLIRRNRSCGVYFWTFFRSVVCLSVCRLSRLCPLLKPFDVFRCHLAGTLVGSNDTLC